jgi:protein subunit release factor B
MSGTTISPEKQKALKERMEKLGLYEDDIVEKFVRSQGKGGQNVNKTSTCVYLKHLPTGIEVKCQRERSQVLNRYLARRLMADKMEESILGKESERVRKIEKIRRQKRKRSKRAKEKILQEKKIQSDKKRQRKKIEVPKE